MIKQKAEKTKRFISSEYKDAEDTDDKAMKHMHNFERIKLSHMNPEERHIREKADRLTDYYKRVKIM